MVQFHDLKEGSIIQNIDFNTMNAGFDHEGVYYGLDVRQSGVGTTMHIMVGSGMGIVQGNRSIGSFFHLIIPPSDATNPRYDLIEFRKDGSPYNVTGLAAGQPFTSGLTSGAIPLGVIRVGSLVTAIVSANIRDVRTRLMPLYPMIESNAAISMTGFINGYKTIGSNSIVPGQFYAGGKSTLNSDQMIFDEFLLGSKTNYNRKLTVGVNPAQIGAIGSLPMFIMVGSLYDDFDATFDHTRWNSGAGFGGAVVESTSGIFFRIDSATGAILNARGSGTAADLSGEFRGKNVDGWALLSIRGVQVAGGAAEALLRIVATNSITGNPALAGSAVSLESFTLTTAERTETRIIHFDRTGSQAKIYTPNYSETGSLLSVATVSLSTLAGSWYLGIMGSTASTGTLSGGIVYYGTTHASGLSGLLTSLAQVVPTNYKYGIGNASLPVGSRGLMKTHHSFDSGTTYSPLGSINWMGRNTVNTGSYVAQFIYMFPPPHAGSEAKNLFCVMQDWETKGMEDII